ncbi:unnamed protein product, partial [marine sediment metagenome]
MDEEKREALIRPCRVTGVHIENVRRIQVIDLTAEHNVNVVGGANGAGKTSLITAMLNTLCGGRGEPAPALMIREGEERAECRVTLDNGAEAHVVWTEKIRTLDVRVDGKRIPRPQEFLNGLTGRVTIDVFEFARGDSKQQEETLKAVAGITEAWDALEAKRLELYAARRDVNRDLKRAEAHLGEMDHYPEAPEEAVSADDLRAEYNAAFKQREVN